MCEICGCTATARNTEVVTMLGRLLEANDRTAAHNRAHFDNHQVAAFNLMSSPGAGKTALLEATIEALKSEFRIAVIEGDLATENDARRIRARGIPALQITTGTACHLDARMVHAVLHDLPLPGLDIVFIENVGNLVCPASFDLGQHRNVVLLSTTEGDDKPAKYPVMFRAADIVLLTKMDLAHLMDDFDTQRAERAVRGLANTAPVVPLSARRGNNFDAWTGWLRGEIAKIREARPPTDLHEFDHGHHRPAMA